MPGDDAYATAELDRLRRRVAELSAEVERLRKLLDAAAPRGGPAVDPESEKRLRLILESATDYAILTLDPEGRVTSWNEGARRILGYAASEIIGRDGAVLFTPEDREQRAPEHEMRTALEQGRAENNRWHLRRDGSRFWATGAVTPLRDRRGAAQGFVKVLRDRTEQHRAEEALRHQFGLVQTITQNTADALFLLDPEGRVTFANPAAERLFGTPDQLIGRVLHDAVHHHHPGGQAYPIEKCPLMGALRSARTVRDHEDVFFRQDGTAVHVFCSIVPIATGRGPAGAVLAVRDITRRKTAEAALKMNQERYQALVKATTVIVWQADANGVITGDVPGWQALTGQTPEQYRGWGWVDAVHPDDVERTIADWTAGLRTRSPTRVEFRVRCRDGLWRNALATAEPVLDAGGELREWVGTVTDITEIRTAADHQRFLMDELSHRVKNTLAEVQAIASHTLRTAESPEAFLESFGARLQALSQAHELLTQGEWKGALLRDVILTELQPHTGDAPSRFILKGRAVRLPPRAALALAMAFHELATNAAKYGALAVPSGTVAISWRPLGSARARTLRIEWQEQGGPTVRPPRRRGFGSAMIERGVAHALGGEVELAFAPSGVRCTMTIPLAR